MYYVPEWWRCDKVSCMIVTLVVEMRTIQHQAGNTGLHHQHSSLLSELSDDVHCCTGAGLGDEHRSLGLQGQETDPPDCLQLYLLRSSQEVTFWSTHSLG